jgi:hypothetical protein
MPDNCDILLFQGSAKKNPMSKEDDDANKLSNIAYGISMEVQHPAHTLVGTAPLVPARNGL